MKNVFEQSVDWVFSIFVRLETCTILKLKDPIKEACCELQKYNYLTDGGRLRSPFSSTFSVDFEWVLVFIES